MGGNYSPDREKVPMDVTIYISGTHWQDVRDGTANILMKIWHGQMDNPPPPGAYVDYQLGGSREIHSEQVIAEGLHYGIFTGFSEPIECAIVLPSATEAYRLFVERGRR